MYLGMMQQLEKFNNSNIKSYRIRQVSLIMLDVLIILLSSVISMKLIEVNFKIPILIYVLINIMFFYKFNCYNSLWSYDGEKEMTSIFIASLISGVCFIIINTILGYKVRKLFYIINVLLVIVMTVGYRLAYRAIRRLLSYISISNKQESSRVLIVGAGSAGKLIIKEIFENPNLNKLPVAIVDDDDNKIGKSISGIPIIGKCSDVGLISKEYEVDEIIFSIANIPEKTKRRILNYCNETKCKIKTIPGIYENNAYEVQQELKRKYGDKLDLEVIIGSVRDEKRVDDIMRTYLPDVVFHAAAHKHVPLMEDSPCEAVKNNVFGTLNVAKKASKYNVKKFVLISTDKAVNPTNIMGATKRCCEMIIQALDRKSKTEFVAVRFGNVLGSNGSVIPLFKKQIGQGGPVTVTHKDITRYFMTIPEAVSLVIEAGSMAKGGEIFVLDMGEPVKIADLAKKLITLSGLEPDVDIKIKYTGLRPGEKLYEELLMAQEDLRKTENNKIFIEPPIYRDENELFEKLYTLRTYIENNKVDDIRDIMKEIVPTYVEEKDNKEEKEETEEQLVSIVN